MAINGKKKISFAPEKNSRPKLRIQMAPKAKLTLKRPSSKTTVKKINERIEAPPRKEKKMGMPIGRVLRSCLASVGAMADEQEDYKADQIITAPSDGRLFKGCMAAVQATIEYEPEAEYEMETSSNLEEKAGNSNESEDEQAPDEQGATEDGGTPDREMTVDDAEDSKKNEKSKKTRRAKMTGNSDGGVSKELDKVEQMAENHSEDADGGDKQQTSSKEDPSPARGKRQGGRVKKQKKPVSEEPNPKDEEETAALEEPTVNGDAEDNTEETPEIPPTRARRLPKQSDEKVGAKEPAAPKRTRATGAPEKEKDTEENAEKPSRSSRRSTRGGTTVESKDNATGESEKAGEPDKRKRGVSKKADASENDSRKEEQGTVESSEAHDEAGEEVKEETEEPKVKRGRGKLAPEKPQTTKTFASPRTSKGKKNVLKVALNIRPRALREQSLEKKAEAEAPVVVASSEERKSGENSEESLISPKVSPRPVRSVRTNKKADRNSRGSDTDTAEETLDEEENLRLLEGKRSLNPPVIVSPITQVRTTVRTVAPKSIIVQSPTSKISEEHISMAKPTIVFTKGNRKRRMDMPELPKVIVSSQAAPKVSAIIAPKRPEISAVISKPGVTVMSPMIISKPGVTVVSPQTLRSPFVAGTSTNVLGPPGAKRIVINMPSTTDGIRQPIRTNTQGGIVKTIVLPKSSTIPINRGHNLPTTTLPQVRTITLPSGSPQNRGVQITTTALPHNRGVRLPTITTANRGMTLTGVRPGVRVLTTPFRTPGAPVGSTSPVVMRNFISNPRQQNMVVLPQRPSIIRGPRMVSTIPGQARTRLISNVGSNLPPNARIVTIRPNMLGQPRPMSGTSNKVIVSSLSPIVPSRQITVQANSSPLTSTPNTSKISTPVVSRITPSIVSRSKVTTKPNVLVKSATQPFKAVQQTVKPVEKKAPAPKKVVTKKNAVPPPPKAPSAVEKLLEEPQMPKATKKPLSKRQKNLRKTESIKTSTRSRRRGTDLQIDYNEDRDEDDDDEEEEEPEETSQPIDEVEELQGTEETEDQETSGPQEDIPVAVVEVFLSQDEVKLREVHSPTKQDLVDLVSQPVEEPAPSGGSDAPEGFFTTEGGGYVETDSASFAVRSEVPTPNCS